MTFSEWYDENGGMSPYGENFVLFTCYFEHLTLNLPRELVKKAIETAIADMNDYLSHDNWTAIVCLSKLYGFDYHEKLLTRDAWRRIHPRDIGFYLFMKYEYRILLLPTVLSMLYAVWHKQITNDTLDTDGKLLSWLRLHHMNMPWLNKLLAKILVKRHNATWADIFKIYFRKEEHPIVLVGSILYGRTWRLDK